MISSTFNECMSQSSKADALSGSFLSHRRTLIMRGLCLMWFETEQAGITQVECADPAELTRYTSLISQSPLETLECCPERNRTSLLVSLSQVKIETEFVGHIFMLQNHWFTSTHCNTVQSNCQSLESKKEKKGGCWWHDRPLWRSSDRVCEVFKSAAQCQSVVLCFHDTCN